MRKIPSKKALKYIRLKRAKSRVASTASPHYSFEKLNASMQIACQGKFSPETPKRKMTADAVKMKGDFYDKSRKNYKHDYGHKDSEELALNYTRDGLREELDNAFAEVSPNNLSVDSAK